MAFVKTNAEIETELLAFANAEGCTCTTFNMHSFLYLLYKMLTRAGGHWIPRRIPAGFFANDGNLKFKCDTTLYASWFQVGDFIRFSTDKATWVYGRIVSSTTSGSDTVYTFMGGAMSASLDDYIDVYSLHPPPMRFLLDGAYGDGTTSDLLQADQNYKLAWSSPKAYIVGFRQQHVTDAGTTNPTMNVQINGQDLLATAIASNDTAEVLSTEVQEEYYDINPAEELEIKVTAAAVGTQAYENTFEIFWVPA